MEDRVELGPKIRELNLYIKNSINDQINKKVKGITHTKGLILHKLRKAESANISLYQKDLEDMLNVNKSTMSEMLDCLEHSELIQRIPDKNDCRRKIIVLTCKGRETDDEVGKVIHQFEENLQGKLTSEELTVLLKMIEKLKKED